MVRPKPIMAKTTAPKATFAQSLQSYIQGRSGSNNDNGPEISNKEAGGSKSQIAGKENSTRALLQNAETVFIGRVKTKHGPHKRTGAQTKLPGAEEPNHH
jgi:hypothetical protein